jgi:glycosyltransferase involved in cell wall biosynthesis
VPRVHPNMLGILEGFIKLDFRITIVSIDPKPYILKDNPRVRIIAAESTNFFKNLQLVVTEKPELVILRASNRYTRQIGKVCFVLRKRTVIYEQTNIRRSDDLKSDLRDMFAVLKRFLLYFNTTVISPIDDATENGTAKSFLKYYFVFPISNNLLSEKVQKHEILSIIIVGKLNQSRKQLVDGLKTIRASNIDGQLIVVGEFSEKLRGIDKCYENLILEASKFYANLEVKIFSNLTHDETLNLIAKSHILFLTSKNEPFSVSPLEAMALGTIPIVPDSNGSTFLIRNRFNDLVYAESNWLQARLILQNLSQNVSKLQEMSVEISRYAHDALSPVASAKRILGIADLSVLSDNHNNFAPNS